MKIEAKGMLFDMDGVLVSSIGSVMRSWRRWAEIYNIPNPESFEVPHGMRAIDIVKMLRPDIDPIEGHRVIEDMEVEDIDGLTVLPGVKALLESLPPERWAIVTSASRRLLLARLTAAGLPIPPRIISGDDVVKGKPDPEPYRRGAELLGFAPAECIVVEDAPSGVNAGLGAGCRVLAVLGTHTADALTAASWVTPSLETLKATSTTDGLELEFAVVDAAVEA